MFLSFSSSSYDVDGSLLHHQRRPSFGSPAAPCELYHDVKGGLLPSPPPSHLSSTTTSAGAAAPSRFHSISTLRSQPSTTTRLPLRRSPPRRHPPATTSTSTPPPVRRALSAGDLQRTHGLAENYGQEGGGAAGRVRRYSAEERKERIERYRSKRNHRNFSKKITYACRKTLADSRPRVRGRFARNGETEAEMAAASGYGSSSMNKSYGLGGEWWSQMLATDDDEDLYYNGDVLVSLAAADVFAMNILS